jgi:hypothetical protein
MDGYLSEVATRPARYCRPLIKTFCQPNGLINTGTTVRQAELCLIISCGDTMLNKSQSPRLPSHFRDLGCSGRVMLLQLIFTVTTHENVGDGVKLRVQWLRPQVEADLLSLWPATNSVARVDVRETMASKEY